MFLRFKKELTTQLLPTRMANTVEQSHETNHMKLPRLIDFWFWHCNGVLRERKTQQHQFSSHVLHFAANKARKKISILLRVLYLYSRTREIPSKSFVYDSKWEKNWCEFMMMETKKKKNSIILNSRTQFLTTGSHSRCENFVYFFDSIMLTECKWLA